MFSPAGLALGKGVYLADDLWNAGTYCCKRVPLRRNSAAPLEIAPSLDDGWSDSVYGSEVECVALVQYIQRFTNNALVKLLKQPKATIVRALFIKNDPAKATVPGTSDSKLIIQMLKQVHSADPRAAEILDWLP